MNTVARSKVFEIAVKKGYCNLYSSYDDIEAGIHTVLKEFWDIMKVNKKEQQDV